MPDTPEGDDPELITDKNTQTLWSVAPDAIQAALSIPISKPVENIDQSPTDRLQERHPNRLMTQHCTSAVRVPRRIDGCTY